MSKSHPGKFEGNGDVAGAAEYVYNLIGEGCADEELDFGHDGDVDYYAVLKGCLVDKPVNRDEYIAKIKESIPDFDKADYNHLFESNGGAILHESNQGFVDVTFYRSVEEMEDDWDDLQLQYEEECKEEEE